MECPRCGRGFVAGGEKSYSRRYDDRDDYRPRNRPRYADEWEDDRDLVEFAKRECSAAGTGLQVVGWLGLVMSPLQLLQMFMMGPGPAEAAWLVGLFLGVFLFIVVLSILQIVGGRQMKQAKSWGLCLAACISGLLSGPFCLGLVFGIMGIVKLSNQRVKRGFQLNNPNYDPDM
jgi:ribosomal protein S27AE